MTDASMPSLLVRKVPPTLIKKLKSFAADEGVSMEEAHRRILEDALGKSKRLPFMMFLQSIPKGEDVEFSRPKDLPREIELE